MARNLYNEVSNRILAELEKGALPWVRPWKSLGNNVMPKNGATGRPYSGTNVVMLWMAGLDNGYGDNRWMTFNQAKELGGMVRKGEKGAKVYYMSTFEKEQENGGARRIPFLKEFTVFNLAQIDGLPEKFETVDAAPRNEDVRVAVADEFLSATGAVYIEGSGEAFYSPKADRISIPSFSSFESADTCYATKFHETGHWTGHESRLNRTEGMKGKFGSETYAFEELVAELTSAFLCAEFGFDGEVRHAGYISSWIKLLKDHQRAFFSAASQAQKAADFLRQKALSEQAAA